MFNKILIKFYSIYIISFITAQDYALRFDGNNDYIVISDHPNLDLTDNYMLET